MADIAVNFALQLLGLALDKIKLKRRVRDDMEWLHRELQRMRCFLLDAERRSSSGDEAVKDWVWEITDAAYEAEDIAAKFARRQQRRGVMVTLQRYGLPSIKLHHIGNDIKRLKEKIVEIRYSIDTYGISSIDSNAGVSNDNITHELRRMPLFQKKEGVFGLENDKKRVMELLQAEESGRYVIGIVGMGGMGKTTLARQVFKSIGRSRFLKLAWVDVSQKYIKNPDSIHKLLYEIAKQVMPDSPDLQSKRTDELSELVKTELKDKRYLIVMDDMWETDVWDLVKDRLPDSKNGSRIIITTRNEKVAEHPALHFPFHRMEGLDDKHSWDLFTHLVFEDEEEITRECIGELKDLAEELVHGCGGSPLALTVLGGLLYEKKKTYSTWKDVLRGEHGKNCLDILKSSYKDLPHNLKWCFLYLSAFPEDHNIAVEKLIRLWVAEGFVANTGSNDEEDIARTYLEGLKQRCLVMVHGEMYNDGYQEYCRIHDVIRELSVFMNSEMNGRRVMYRLSLQDQVSSNAGLKSDGKSLSLRTLLNFTRENPIGFEKFYLLRVLDLEGAYIHELPKEVGDMVLLRYLSIRDTQCRSLPRSISRLSYLETLDCRSFFMMEIPNNVWKIKTLKHVYRNYSLDKVDVSHLIKLQTLVSVTASSISNSIHRMTNLQELSIWDIFSDCATTIWNALQSLPSLKFLSLHIFDMIHLVSKETGFPCLQRLTMNLCDIISWEVEEGSMPSLDILVMNECRGIKRLPSGLAHCKRLRIIDCNMMSDEFHEWYHRSKEENAAWEFHHVQSITLSEDLMRPFGLSS